MSSVNSYPRCALDIRPSRTLGVACLLVTGAVIAGTLISGLPFYLSLAVMLLALIAMLHSWRWVHGELQRITWLPDGRWQLTGRDGRAHEMVQLLPGILVGPQLVALHWHCDCCQERFRVALLRDNCHSDKRRELCVRLRLSSDEELFREH